MIFQPDNSGRGVFRLEGPLTIQQATGFRDALAKAIEATEDLEVDLTSVEEVDVACLQVICSALVTCGGMNKALAIRDRASGACVRAFEAAGLSSFLAGNLRTD